MRHEHLRKVLAACAAIVIAGASLGLIGDTQSSAVPVTPATTSTLTPTPTPAPRAVARASRTSVRIPPNLGNTVETPRFLTTPSGYRYKVRTNTPAKRYAQKLLSPRQYACVHELWMRESGWSPTSLGARTKAGRAYGIPQIKRMKERNPLRQVDRGLRYIEQSSQNYGTPCRALAAHMHKGWY